MMPTEDFPGALRDRFGIPKEGHTLAAVLAYALDAQGALIRPRLAMIAALRCGWSKSAAYDFAAATELFHTASLVLDDLPCMDDATLRRGRPCVHRVHGEPMALLAAVFMINRGFMLTHRATEGLGFSSRERARLFADAQLGADGVLLGQALDLAARSTDTTPAAKIADLKTGALLRYALMLPVVARGAAREESVLENLSRTWGELYQLIDDMRDVGLLCREAGKDAAVDARTGSPNAVREAGSDAAIKRCDILLRESEIFVGFLANEHPAWGELRAIHDRFVSAVSPVARSLPC